MQEKNQLKNNLLAISPLDGRYYNQIEVLSNYFSEYALIKKRIFVELKYLSEIVFFIKNEKINTDNIYNNLNDEEAIKKIRDINKAFIQNTTQERFVKHYYDFYKNNK